jgi:hypothetical protein
LFTGEAGTLGGAGNLKRFDRTFVVTNRLRTEGLDHLLVAAKGTFRNGSLESLRASTL